MYAVIDLARSANESQRYRIVDEEIIEGIDTDGFIDTVYLDTDEGKRRLVGQVLEFFPLLASAYEYVRERMKK